MFIGAYQNDSKKRIIFKLYKELMKNKLQTTEYVNQKWEKQGNLVSYVEFCMEMHKFSRMAGI